ncbi:MAG: hypothetical protein V7K24_25255 [Nostoc sp.]
MQLSDSSSLAQELLPQRLDIFVFETPLTPVKPALAFAYSHQGKRISNAIDKRV